MSRMGATAILFALVAMAAVGCRTGGTGKPADELRALTPGDHTRTLVHDGRERSYILHVPASLSGAGPYPVVLVFHGGSGNAQTAIEMTGFNDVADTHGFLVVYPNGTGRFSDERLLTWNGGGCCAYAQEANVDDVGFVRAVIKDLEAVAPVDRRRIYATGMSNGGILSHRLGCEAADLIAAIAPVAGTLNFSPCAPSRPISVIMFHGTADEHLPYEGGVGRRSLVGVDFASVRESADFWVRANGCADQPRTESFADIRHDIWVACTDSATVELYTIIDGGHAWPGGRSSGRPGADEPARSISASKLIWDFFAAHPMPVRGKEK
jgi:polyhydroxybutyrate depolymerase